MIYVCIIIIIILYIAYHFINKKSNEKFSDYGYVAMNMKDCNDKTLTECLRFQNCGYVMTRDFNNRCVAGDVYGPYNKKIKYDKWYHNDPYTRALIANDNNYRNMRNYVFN